MVLGLTRSFKFIGILVKKKKKRGGGVQNISTWYIHSPVANKNSQENKS